MNLFTRTFSKIFKSSNQQELDNLKNTISAINDHEKVCQSLNESDFKRKQPNLKKMFKMVLLKLTKSSQKVLP